jgi:hypothetical protein
MAVVQQHEKHLNLAMTAREVYNNMCQEARAASEGSGLPRPPNFTQHYSFDFAQQVFQY